nr:MAG TPA: hypothetical protein [Bacteriophage sp.]
MSKNLVKEVVWSKTKLYIRDTVGWMSWFSRWSAKPYTSVRIRD